MSSLLALQSAVTARLRSAPWRPSGVEILDRLRANVGSDIEAALANTGLCLYVFPPLISSTRPNIPQVLADRCQLRIRILEHPQLNTTGLDAYLCAEGVMTRLHNWSPNIPPTGNRPLYLEPTPLDDQSTDDRIIFDILLLGTLLLTIPDPLSTNQLNAPLAMPL